MNILETARKEAKETKPLGTFNLAYFVIEAIDVLQTYAGMVWGENPAKALLNRWGIDEETK